MNEKELEQDKLQSNDDSITDTTETAESTDTPIDRPDTDDSSPTTEIEDAVVVADSSEASTSGETAAASASDETSEPRQESGDAEPEGDKKSRSWIGALAFILALCALIVAGYGFQKIQELQAETAALKSSTAELNDSISAKLEQGIAEASKISGRAEAQIGSLKSEFKAQQANVNELQDRLTRTSKQISQIGTNKRKDWLLAEVEYLLRLANQRVLMEKSPVGALALLQSSDRILKETDDVSIYNVRKALAQDIAALESVPRLDIDGIFLKLAALNEQVANLRLIPVSDKRELPELLQQVTPDSVSESWNQGLKESWNQTMDKLEKLVVIQHRDEPIEPLLSPEQVYFLQQNLHLMIEQAQLSLLQGQQGSYDASLNKATDWISKYFQAEDSHTQALLRGLNELKSVEVAPELPDISASLKALKSYLAEVHDAKGAA